METRWPIRLLTALLLVLGLSGIGIGLAVLVDPVGAGIGLGPEWLEGSPFSDHRIPGLVAMVILGALPLSVVGLVVRRSPWAWSASLMVGLVLMAWLYVEILVIGYHPRPPLQAIYGLLGVAVVALTLHPAVRRGLGERDQGPGDAREG
ncbi:MAG TPA: hypothetical protein VLA43_09930 [Longimicrobiales bacterium]|nr:hypothetical protein [Longimicrobiales bacterium]